MSENIVYTERPGSFEDFKAILTAIYDLAGGNPVLDLGCGEAHVTKHWDGVYVDLNVRPTAPGKTMKFDILEAPQRLAGHQYNLMVMADVIEHLAKGPGERLLEAMLPLCKAQFIFTPIGPWNLNPNATDPDVHKSAWFPKEFRAMGWEVLAYTAYHRYDGGVVLGAFFAWRFRDMHNPPIAAVLQMAGIEL